MDQASELDYAREEGLEQGIEQGKREEKIKTAKKMLEKNIPIETIIELTELTKEEIMN